jgi:hypothetical protein
MPVQINEMVIRANIVETGDKEKSTEEKLSTSEPGNVDKNEIIKECAALVMEIINSKNER